MSVLAIVLGTGVLLLLAGRFYGRFIARRIGEDPGRPTPARLRGDGRDFVATPTSVVFAHHFASIAGAGPIIGPVVAVIYGWLPALIWVVLGGVLIGGVHDYLATAMATREGGQSLVTVARRYLGRDAFVALSLFVILMLALVCGTFLNASATALANKVPLAALPSLTGDASPFRVVAWNGQPHVIVGGIASMSVIVITAIAPLLGWLYLRKNWPIWRCSLIAAATCAVGIAVGVYWPVNISPNLWKLLLSAYVLVAAGVPVWIFLQSRDFINVHILYVGMIALVATLIVAGLRGSPADGGNPLPMLNVHQGSLAKGLLWPFLFINVACGAVSGFHSLCAGGTTCKQLKTEQAGRTVGYYGMLLETFLAVCVIGVMMLGLRQSSYLGTLYPRLAGLAGEGNPILTFALAVGQAGHLAWSIPPIIGVVAGMVLLEGFLVTTLDTAVRLTRYLLEEVWRALLDQPEPPRQPTFQPIGAGGLPTTMADPCPADAPVARPRPAPRGLARLLGQYWFNSGLAVALMLLFAFSGSMQALWGMFATANQLLAVFGLTLASVWLLRQRRSFWFAALPAGFMLLTTGASMVLLLRQYAAGPTRNVTLLAADLVMLALTLYLLASVARSLIADRTRRPAQAVAGGD